MAGADFPRVSYPEAMTWTTRRAVTLTRAGVAISQPGRLYAAVLVAQTGTQYAQLFDSTNVPQNILGAVAAPAGQIGQFPNVPYTAVPLRRGLYVSFSDPGTERTLCLLWG